MRSGQKQLKSWQEFHWSLTGNINYSQNWRLNGYSSHPVCRLLTADYKCDKYVKIAQLYLEDDEYFEADRYLTKASVNMHDVKDINIQLRYKVLNFNSIYQSGTLS